MKWLVLNDKGERIWVDQQPIWKLGKNGKESNTGFLPDGTKVRKAISYNKSKLTPSKYEYKRPRGRPRKS